MRSRTYLIASLVPALAFAAAGSLGMLNVFLPALPVIVALWRFEGWSGVAGCSAAHGLLFALANSYLVFLAKRNRHTKWIWVPSLVALGLLLVLATLHYSMNRHYAIQYEGIAYYRLYTFAALWTFGIAVLWLRRIIRDAEARDLVETGRRVLWLNAFLHVLFLTVAFPYFGELP